MFPIIFSRVLTTVVASIIAKKIIKQFNKKGVIFMLPLVIQLGSIIVGRVVAKGINDLLKKD